METSISNGETSELPGVSIGISATLDGGGYEPKLEQLLIEKASMSTQVSDEVANLRSNRGIRVNNEVLEFIVYVRIVDVFVEVFGDPRQLRNQAQGVDN